MRKSHIGIMLMVTLFMAACQNNSRKKVTLPQDKLNPEAILLSPERQNINNDQVLVPKDTAYLDINGKSYRFLAGIPDSLRTEQQQEYLKKLYRVLVKYTEVENNHQVFKLNEDSFVKRGLSKYDYQLMVNGVRDNNAFFDSTGAKDVELLFKNWKSDVEKLLKK